MKKHLLCSTLFFDKFVEIFKEENIKLNLTSLTTAPQFESLIANKYSKTKRLHYWFHVKNTMMKDVEKLKTLSDLIIWDSVILQEAPSHHQQIVQLSLLMQFLKGFISMIL